MLRTLDDSVQPRLRRWGVVLDVCPGAAVEEDAFVLVRVFEEEADAGEIEGGEAFEGGFQEAGGVEGHGGLGVDGADAEGRVGGGDVEGGHVINGKRLQRVSM